MSVRNRSCRMGPHRVRGVVMIITLVALVLVLIGAVALVRSMRASSLVAGNLAVKRDLLNQGERGISAATAALYSGALAAEADREAHKVSANYWAVPLASNGEGLPKVLVKDSAFTEAGFGPENDIKDTATGLEIRYVIDRQCTTTGPFSPTNCEFLMGAPDRGGSDFLKKPAGPQAPIYRISVRVKDTRRNTQTFSQAFATR